MSPATSLLDQAVTLSDFEALARQALPHMAFEYIAGGAGDEWTLRANRDAFERTLLRPRALVDVSNIDTSLTLLGTHMPFPILLAPCAYNKLFHSEGEMETVRGANLSGATLVASTASTVSLEEMAAASNKPLWFQLYTSRDREFTWDLVRRAEECGCAAICVTVDVPVRGMRDRDTRAQFDLPAGIERPNFRGLSPEALKGNPRATGRHIYSPNLDPSFTWADLDEMRRRTRLPLLAKGVLTAADALRFVDAGCDGLIVSNHGARTLDTLPAALDALREIAPALAGRAPLLLDGGVLRGTDVVKALALGASAVLIGRPYLYALAIAGAAGVVRCVDMLQRELEMSMALLGRPDLASVDASVLW